MSKVFLIISLFEKALLCESREKERERKSSTRTKN